MPYPTTLKSYQFLLAKLLYAESSHRFPLSLTFILHSFLVPVSIIFLFLFISAATVLENYCCFRAVFQYCTYLFVFYGLLDFSIRESVH